MLFSKMATCVEPSNYSDTKKGAIDLDEIRDLLRQFNTERDWKQFHTPENLSKSIAIEAGELLECFQWSATEYNKDALTEELADVMMYCIMLADAIGVDPKEIMLRKLEKNRAKYPVDKAKGSSRKYTEFEDEK